MKSKALIILIIWMLSLIFIGCDIEEEKPEEGETSSFNLTKYKESYQEEFEKREDYLLDYLSKYHFTNFGTKFGFGISAIKFKLYEETKDESYLDSALEHTRKTFTNFVNKADSFAVYNAAFHYGLFNKYYPEDLKEFAREALITSVGYAERPSTTNHALMAAVGRYLVSEYFPDAEITPYYGYDSPQTDDPTAIKTIRGLLNAYPITGVYEYNSDTYFACHYIPLLAIAMCSKDAELANQARMVIENSLFTLAPIYLEGHMAAASERSYMPYAAQNYGGLSNILLWYYFGGSNQYPTKAEMDFMETYALGFVLYSDFMPNWIATAIARDREETYLHQELHFYNKTRWETIFATFMQTYMNIDYSVFSSKTKVFSPSNTYTNAYNGYYRQPLNWGVRWISDNPSSPSTFSIQNVSNIDTSRQTKFGTTAYSQVLQNNGTVIGVFDIPENYEFPGLLIYQPDNYLALIDEAYLGRVYAHYGNLIIAYYLSVPFVFSITDSKIRTQGVTKAYFACEVIDSKLVDGATPDEQLLLVQSMLEGGFKNIEADLTNKTWMRYKALDGSILSMQYGGDEQDGNETIDGKLIDYTLQNYPLQKNPWVMQEWEQKVITYNYKNYSITFDFEQKTIKEDKE